MGSSNTIDARRFLHCCYCCDDSSAATGFLSDGLDLRVFMQTTGEAFDGTVLGLKGMVSADVSFAYDNRGPRTSPGIEVQAWIDPPAEGVAHASPCEIGVQALGCAVADVPRTLRRVERAGAVVVGRSDGSVLFSGASATIRDPNGITFDLVHDAAIGENESRLAHLRVSCRDLDESVGWYEHLGFSLRRRLGDVIIDASTLSVGGRVALAELTLPDEPMNLLLVQWLDPAPTGSHYPVANHRGIYRAAIGVDDTRGAVRKLEAAGMEIARQPELLELRGTPVPDMWIAFLADPDGVPIELVERPRSAFRDAPQAVK